MGLVDAVTKILDGEESEGIYFEADAQALGLRVLRPPEVKTSGAASKKVKRTKTVGMNGNRKGGSDSDKKVIGDESVQTIGEKKGRKPDQASAAAMARRDSFDEAIEGLPGLDDLDDLDDMDDWIE